MQRLSASPASGWDQVAQLDIAGITADSRSVVPGDLFAAIPGSTADGRQFIGDAVRRGAVAVLAPLGTTWPAGVPPRPVIFDPEPRRALARIAAALAGTQPATIAAVTGTNGKTSTVEFARQLWGEHAASLGTVGCIAQGFPPGPGLTTPDPVTLAETLAGLARHGVTRAAMEASSHGLHQYRLDGVRLSAGAFTNLTRDHLDYHQTMEAYRQAKLRLFTDLLPRGAPAIANADMDLDTLAALRQVAAERRLDLRTVGEAGDFYRLLSARPRPDGQDLTVEVAGTRQDVTLNLPGRFQADNALLAAALTAALGLKDALRRLPALQGVRGRMELAARLPNGAAAYVDYAHTPDALRRLLQALRPHTDGRLHVVFGAGGDRDRGKRPLMGEAAAELADVAIVTDDNPRTEDPAAIRAAVLAACPDAREIPDRARAIESALTDLRHGDVLVVAGKGHEQGQIVGTTVHPFDDASVIRALAGRRMTALWTAADLHQATGGALSVPFAASGVSIDTRTLAKGDLFVALVGEGRDGHAFVADAIAKGAAGAMVHAPTDPALPVLRVDDTLAALARLGGFGRLRSTARFVAVTGSVGKTTTKEMLRACLSVFGPTHAAVASYNNHWGLPLTLARTPREAAFCVAEIGMNHPGEIAPLSRLTRPHVALITAIAAAHIGHLGSIEAIADEKASIMTGLEDSGTAVLPADTPLLPRLRAGANGHRVLTFGTDREADIRLLRAEPDADGSALQVDIVGRIVSFRLNAPGPHMAMNATAALATVAALGLDPQRVPGALEAFTPLAGRGLRRTLSIDGGSLLLLDESYNGNGASMRAALAVLGLQPARRRIAVLGDMLELGDAGPAEHAGLAGAVAASTDLLFTCGPLMRHLHDAVPADLRGAHETDSAALAPIIAAAARKGDAILVKGSLGSAMKRVVTAIEANPTTERAGRC